MVMKEKVSLTLILEFVDTRFDLRGVCVELVQCIVSRLDAGSGKHAFVSHIRAVVRETGAQDGGCGLWSDAFQCREGRDSGSQIRDLPESFLCRLFDRQFRVYANQVQQLTPILSSGQLPLCDLHQLLVRHMLVPTSLNVARKCVVEPVPGVSEPVSLWLPSSSRGQDGRRRVGHKNREERKEAAGGWERRRRRR